MKSTQISFNYFYIMFLEKFRKNILETERRKIGKYADILNDIFDLSTTGTITQEEQLSLYNKTLFDVCTNYVTIANADIDVLPVDAIEFVDLILDTIHENPYKESFLMSLQFIYQNYFECLGKGSPILMATQDDESLSSLKVTLNSCYKITEFDAINMDLVEQDKIMTKILSMESKNEIGPIPKVLYRVRKDI